MARRYFPHIYFESKKPGKDSVYEAVPDLGRPGVRTAKEVKFLAAATVADLADGKTVNHRGQRVRFTRRLLSGRFLVLRLLAKKYGGKRDVEKAWRIAIEAMKIRDKAKRKRFIKRELRKLGVPAVFIEQVMARTNAGSRRRSKKSAHRSRRTRKTRRRRR